MKRLVIPDDLFWIVRGASGACGIDIISMKGDRGEPISWEGVGVGVGQKGREVVIEQNCRSPLSGEGVLKRSGYQ